MGRFCASLLLLLGACGDNVDGDGLGPGQTDDINPGGNGDVIPRYVPAVCGLNQWTPTIGADPTMRVSVAQRPGGGATLLGVPSEGSPMFGFNVRTYADDLGDGTKVPISGTFDHVSVSYVNDRPVSTATAGGAVFVHALDENLDNPQYITKLRGSFVGEPAFYWAQNNLVMPVVDDSGLWLHRFDDSLEPIDSKQILATKPATALAVAQLGGAVMSAWSTDTECYMSINATYGDGVTARVGQACPSPQLATNQLTREGVMLFDSPEGVRLMAFNSTKLGGEAPIIRSDASSPRTLFDGTNYWVTYLDARGDIVIGFLDANRHPVTMSLNDPRPERNAYELTLVDGEPWVFSIDSTGYNAYRLCVDTIW